MLFRSETAKGLCPDRIVNAPWIFFLHNLSS
jgi:hypothetical protein